MSIDFSTASRQTLETICVEQKTEIANLKARVAWFERQVFGQKTERLVPQDPRQSTLFDVPESPPAESTSVKSYERSVRSNPTDTGTESSIRFDESVPVDEVIVYPRRSKDCRRVRLKSLARR